MDTPDNNAGIDQTEAKLLDALDKVQALRAKAKNPLESAMLLLTRQLQINIVASTVLIRLSRDEKPKKELLEKLLDSNAQMFGDAYDFVSAYQSEVEKKEQDSVDESR